MNMATRHRHGEAWGGLPDERPTIHGWPYFALIAFWVALPFIVWWLP